MRACKRCPYIQLGYELKGDTSSVCRGAVYKPVTISRVLDDGADSHGLAQSLLERRG